MPRTALERITDREQQLTAAREQIRTQISELTARLADLDAELADLTVARKVVPALGEDEPTRVRILLGCLFRVVRPGLVLGILRCPRSVGAPVLHVVCGR